METNGNIMKLIETNNKTYLVIRDSGRALTVEHHDHDDTITSVDSIPLGDVVMLINYWRNCKDGIEKSDYIK